MNAVLNALTYAVGQTVRLVGGGPSMTVCATEKTGLVLCRWFVGGIPYTHYFQPSVLELIAH